MDAQLNAQATLRFGHVFLEREEHTGGITIMYARKWEFSNILQFWSYANLALNAIGYSARLVCVWFDWSERQSRLLSPTDFWSAVDTQCPVQDHLPVVLQEAIIQGWKYSPDWNEWFAIIETSDSFVLWCWRALQ